MDISGEIEQEHTHGLFSVCLPRWPDAMCRTDFPGRPANHLYASELLVKF